MNRTRSALLVFSLLACMPSALSAAPAHPIAPAVESNRVEAQRTCHHYRWSSQSRCTSTRLLRQSIEPPLHYPRRYYGTPHYAQFFPYYGYRRLYYSPYGFYRYPWYRRPYW